MTKDNKIYVLLDYEDTYVQPLLEAGLKARLPAELLVLVRSTSDIPSPNSKLLQWRQYEALDFDHTLSHPSTSLANSYIIRKALIRKHYLSTTVRYWLAKHPESALRRHIKPGVDFEVDYAEFLDDALVEAWELKESWGRNERLGHHQAGEEGREWWILKPGMSERGQGIRLFSTEAELQAIFDEWGDPKSDDEDDDDMLNGVNGSKPETNGNSNSNGIMTSHLRHFTAQPYIHPPLLLSPPHASANRKFHIRAYVLAVGAVRIYIYKPMLALFAEEQYAPPSISSDPTEGLARHLTNTCLQSGEREGSVEAFWSLPDGDLDKEAIFKQICSATAEIFEAGSRTMGIHFQPLPNAFEIFGLDFLVDASGTAWLLEVNSFPDFAQTGEVLQGLVEDLMGEVVDIAVKPFFGLEGASKVKGGQMRRVLDIDLGRR